LVSDRKKVTTLSSSERGRPLYLWTKISFGGREGGGLEYVGMGEGSGKGGEGRRR